MLDLNLFVWDFVVEGIGGLKVLNYYHQLPSNENYIYVASYSRIKVSKDAGQNWTYIKPGLPNYNITDIAEFVGFEFDGFKWDGDAFVKEES